MACVRYSGSNLDCVGLTTGETLEQLVVSLDNKMCDLSSGVDGENGDSAYQIWLNLGNLGTEQDFLDSLVGPAGSIGATGSQGPVGAQGPSGINGTNAFKFVKDFEGNLDGSIFTITRLELLSCNSIPNGCLFDGASAEFTNIHVQVWMRDNEPPSPSGPWFLAGDNNTRVYIDNSTGTISVELFGGSTDVLARVVVLG
jgi:hypothetical protein